MVVLSDPHQDPASLLWLDPGGDFDMEGVEPSSHEEIKDFVRFLCSYSQDVSMKFCFSDRADLRIGDVYPWDLQ